MAVSFSNSSTAMPTPAAIYSSWLCDFDSANVHLRVVVRETKCGNQKPNQLRLSPTQRCWLAGRWSFPHRRKSKRSPPRRNSRWVKCKGDVYFAFAICIVHVAFVSFAIFHLPLPFAICHLPFVFCHLPFAILPFAIFPCCILHVCLLLLPFAFALSPCTSIAMSTIISVEHLNHMSLKWFVFVFALQFDFFWISFLFLFLLLLAVFGCATSIPVCLPQQALLRHCREPSDQSLGHCFQGKLEHWIGISALEHLPFVHMSFEHLSILPLEHLSIGAFDICAFVIRSFEHFAVGAFAICHLPCERVPIDVGI